MHRAFIVITVFICVHLFLVVFLNRYSAIRLLSSLLHVLTRLTQSVWYFCAGSTCELKDIVRIAGQDAVLTCSNGTSWRKMVHGVPVRITAGDKYDIQYNLVIRDAAVSDSGIYICYDDLKQLFQCYLSIKGNFHVYTQCSTFVSFYCSS